ncbi:hypothetical protein KIW84_040759 [Lathyrus oleraceus]|uniref:tRNA pseudouridine synthase n=1 Tax=Pisum sativum TaxID=3888 RepID=A0A9D4X7X8_PEA|nr:hypothetical protein KIW84_040759 [Pisum sativum]
MNCATAATALASPLPSPTSLLSLNSSDVVEVKPNQNGYKWRLVLAYDGTRYSGWQYQESPPTVQCAVEKALIQTTKLQRKDLQLVGASRTDAGVHAWGCTFFYAV